MLSRIGIGPLLGPFFLPFFGRLVESWYNASNLWERISRFCCMKPDSQLCSFFLEHVWKVPWSIPSWSWCREKMVQSLATCCNLVEDSRHATRHPASLKKSEDKKLGRTKAMHKNWKWLTSIRVTKQCGICSSLEFLVAVYAWFSGSVTIRFAASRARV